MASPLIPLNDGRQMPQLGLGVYKVNQDIAVQLVQTAIEIGYRRIDTAALYDNEAEVGAAIRKSGLEREEIFVTTKIWKDDHGHDRALKAINESLARLDIDYIDLLLIHWPSPAQNKFVETWEAFQKAQQTGKIRGIGVSNFQPAHLDTLLAAGGTVPAINQIELHPGLQQHSHRGLVSPCQRTIQREPGYRGNRGQASAKRNPGDCSLALAAGQFGDSKDRNAITPSGKHIGV